MNYTNLLNKKKFPPSKINLYYKKGSIDNIYKFKNITKSKNNIIGYDECINKINNSTDLKEKAKYINILFKKTTNVH